MFCGLRCLRSPARCDGGEVGSWSKQNEEKLLETYDHKPELEEEQERIHNHNPPGEVRQLSADQFRIYIPGPKPARSEGLRRRVEFNVV